MASLRGIRLLPVEPPELVIHDERSECAYLPDRVARLPMRLPLRPLDRQAFQDRLEQGDRRQGRLLYRPHCPECRACEAIRIPVDDFQPSQSQRRAWRRGCRELTTEVAPLELDAHKVALYEQHKRLRGLAQHDATTTPEVYKSFLVDSCTEGFELRFSLGAELVGVAVTDRAARSLSAVYTYFDPTHERLNIGTFSILMQVELCRQWGLEHLYLGLYVADCDHMRYKARYLPHERLVDGDWRRYERPERTAPCAL